MSLSIGNAAWCNNNTNSNQISQVIVVFILSQLSFTLHVKCTWYM